MPLPNAPAASRRAAATASVSSPGVVTTRMPRPPPPKAALTSTGNPISVPARSASPAGNCSPSPIAMPGSTGTPAAAISCLAEVLEPMDRIAAGGGPTNVSPAAAQASAKSAFSDRNP